MIDRRRTTSASAPIPYWTTMWGPMGDGERRTRDRRPQARACPPRRTADHAASHAAVERARRVVEAARGRGHTGGAAASAPHGALEAARAVFHAACTGTSDPDRIAAAVRTLERFVLHGEGHVPRQPPPEPPPDAPARPPGAVRP